MSVFQDSLVFLDHMGLFDVVLPFLLIFTLVFGVLEKSRIFGTEKSIDGKGPYTRKNLNAMVAFVTGFFVVASAQLVALINVFVARTAVILVILIMFMILVGAMHKQQDNEGLNLFQYGWAKALLGVVFAAVILIFLDGVGWLEPAWYYLINHWDAQLVSTILLFLFIVGFIWFVTSAPKGDKSKE
jgi:hypothetical protein